VPVPSRAEGSVNFVQLNEAFDAWTKQCQEGQKTDSQSAEDVKPWLQRPSVGTWLSHRVLGDDTHEQTATSLMAAVGTPCEAAPTSTNVLAPAAVAPVANASPAKKGTAGMKAERQASPLRSANRATSPRVVKATTTATAVTKSPPSPTKQPRLSTVVPAPTLSTSKSFDARRPSPTKEQPEATSQKKALGGAANKALLQRRPSPAKDRAPITGTPASKDKADKPTTTPRVASKPQPAAEQHTTSAAMRSPSVGKGTSPRVHRPSQPPAGVDKKGSPATTPAQTQQRSKSPPAVAQASVLQKKKHMSTAELEAQALEEKRQELRKLSEQNARRMARMSAVNTQVLKVSTPARSQTSIKRAPTPQSALAGLRRQSAAMQKTA